jgi:hypothetical protein
MGTPTGRDYFCVSCGAWMFWSSYPINGTERCRSCGHPNPLGVANQSSSLPQGQKQEVCLPTDNPRPHTGA